MFSGRDVKLSVVIPAYNEEGRLYPTLRKISGYLGGTMDYEIIVVDDGSSDNTARLCEDFFSEEPCGRLIKNRVNRGKGYSVRRGMLAASGGLCLFSDADMSTPIEEVKKLIGAVESGCDAAVGSRAAPGSEIRVRQPFYREKMGRVFNLAVRMLTVKKILDTQCGFKLFRRECARDVFGRCRLDGFSFDVEALFIAEKLGYKTGEVPVVWINSPSSRVSVFKDSLRMLCDLFYIRFTWVRGGYGA